MHKTKNKNIVIVDDESDIREVLQRILMKTDCSVSTFDDGVAALEYIKNNVVDIIFLDIMMPGMNGIQLLKKIVNLKIESIQIVVVSGFANEDIVKECNNLGVKKIIDKPFEVKTILEVVNELLE